MTSTTVTPLPYRGGKAQLAPWIASQLPNRRAYIEPCGGMASVLLSRRQSDVEQLNDRDDRIVTWWRVLRHRTDELAKMLACTPLSETERRTAAVVNSDPDNYDEMTVAWSVAVSLRQGVAGRLSDTPGGDGFLLPSPTDASLNARATWARTWRHLPDSLAPVADRLAEVYLTCRDGMDVLARWRNQPEAVIYLDPPYAADGRGYRHAFNYQAAIDLLSDATAAVAISGYPSCPWDELGWRRADRHLRSSGLNLEEERTECLWMNYPSDQPTLL